MEKIPIPNPDPSVGIIKFTAEEIADMKRVGMSDADIKDKLEKANRGIANAHIKEQLEGSGIEVL